MDRNYSILIVEDDISELGYCLDIAREAGFEVAGSSSELEALKILSTRHFDYIFIDLFLKGHSQNEEPLGLNLIAQAIKIRSSIKPIVMSSCPDAKLFNQAFNAGALYAIKKPILGADEFKIATRLATEKKNYLYENNFASDQSILEEFPNGLVLDDDTLKLVNVGVKNPNLPFVIIGDTGTGKEEVAKLVHSLRIKQNSSLSFVAVNCALLDSDLSSSLLFGHQKGAFSGAYKSTHGFIGEAHNGILFLDEVHTLPLSCQKKLLRVLNDGSYTRIGETREQKSKFQLIVASTLNLDNAVAEGKMLIDLRMRLIGIDIKLKSLRDRKDKIRDLIKIFFAKKGVNMKDEELKEFERKLSFYRWPGNIRQLYQCLQTMLAISSSLGERPNLSHLPKLTM